MSSKTTELETLRANIQACGTASQMHEEIDKALKNRLISNDHYKKFLMDGLNGLVKSRKEDERN